MNELNQKMVCAGALKPILAHKGIFLGCLSLPILICLGVIAFISPMYESQAILQVGLVQSDPIEKISMFIARLDGALSQQTKIEKVSGRVVRISARAESAEKAQKYLIGITTQILSHHKNIFRKHYEPQIAHQEYLNNELTRLKKQLDELEETLEASGESNDVKEILMYLRKTDLRNGFLNLKEQYFRVSNNLLEDHWQQTVLLQAPTFPESPKRPKPLLYMSLAVILGLALGLFSVFYANSLVHGTKRSDEHEQ